MGPVPSGIINLSMIAQTDTPSEDASGCHGTEAHVRRRPLWLRLLLIAGMGVIGVLFAITLGFLGGAYVAMLAYAFVGMALVWGYIRLVIAAIRRSGVRKGRLVRLIVGTVCWGGLTLTVYLVWWRAVRDLRSGEFLETATVAEIRSRTHRSLLLALCPHDEYLYLMDIGDESSVPYMIWSLWWMPEKRACTHDHGLEALTYITNHSAASTQVAWVRWYSANRNKTILEWWADGFTAEGYAVSAAGGDSSIRNLLAVLGRTPWRQPERKPWLSQNALRMLARLNGADVRHIVADVMRNGPAQQRCGAAHYAVDLDRAESEAILRKLLCDRERAVRLWATGILCRRQLGWLKNPAGWIEARHDPGAMEDDAFFRPTGRNVAAAKEGIHHNVWGTQRGHQSRITVASSPVERPGPGNLAATIRIDWQGTDMDALATVSMEGLSPASGKTTYSRELITTSVSDAEELRWLHDPQTHSVYVSVPGFTCKTDPRSGQIVWEMGYGTDNCDELSLFGDYLVIYDSGDLVICDAVRGGILAVYELDDLFDDRLSVVDGRLRAKDDDGRLYVLRLPQVNIPAGPSREEGVRP